MARSYFVVIVQAGKAASDQWDSPILACRYTAEQYSLYFFLWLAIEMLKILNVDNKIN
jgi:hypothetical protein